MSISVLVCSRPFRWLAAVMSSGQKCLLACRRYFLLLIAAGVFTGCAPALSRHLRDQAKPPIPFPGLQKSVKKYEGRVVIYGGYILDTANNPNGTVLTILQAPLDSSNEPISQDLSQGRFLVLSKKFLDPEIYSKGRKITVGGKVTGALSKTLGNRFYDYPEIEALELHLWPKESRYASPYYPYYYDPWYSPWYYP
ncbi:MAG: Slp family lipoprotein [Deltaproteobacteria bacterium]